MNISKALNTLKEPFEEKELKLDVLLRHMVLTYMFLRMVLGIVAIAFPFVFLLGGSETGSAPEVLRSISVYYHTELKVFFVGGLLLTGVLLLVYQGYSRAENYALDVAGLLAFCIALIPTEPLDIPERSIFTVHNVCAVLFFFAIAYVCIFKSRETVKHLDSERARNWYTRIYYILGGAMVYFPLMALFFAIINNASTTIFWMEAIAVWVFGIFWLLKSYEIGTSSFGVLKHVKEEEAWA